MADILTTISIISFVAAGIMTVMAVVIFFVFKIPVVMGDLSGRNARKSIEKLRENNEKTGRKLYESSKTNVSRGKLTETIKKKESVLISANGETGLLNENYKTDYTENETGILGEKTQLLSHENETVQLNGVPEHKVNRVSSITFEYIDNIVIINTDEVIG